MATRVASSACKNLIRIKVLDGFCGPRHFGKSEAILQQISRPVATLARQATSPCGDTLWRRRKTAKYAFRISTHVRNSKKVSPHFSDILRREFGR
jgi:hypothetical protein